MLLLMIPNKIHLKLSSDNKKEIIFTFVLHFSKKELKLLKPFKTFPITKITVCA